MAISKSFDFKNTSEVTTPQELIHAQDLYGMIGRNRGFGIISGCAITRATNQISIASGSVLINGTIVTFAGGNVTVDDTGMSSGQHRWTNVYITAGGAIGKTDGTATVSTGQPIKTTDTTNLVVCSALKLYGSDLSDDRVVSSSLEFTPSDHTFKSVIVENQGAGSNPKFVSSSSTQTLSVDGNLLIDSAFSLAMVNAGAGGNPIFTANSTRQEFIVTGGLDISAEVGILQVPVANVGLTIGGDPTTNAMALQPTWTTTGAKVLVDMAPHITFSGTTSILRHFGMYWSNVAGNTVTDWQGLYIQTPGNSGGLTNAYGIWIGDQDQASTLNYAIYTGLGDVRFGDTLTLATVINAGTDTDKFLVLDSSNNVDFRTGAEVLSDIGVHTKYATSDFATDYETKIKIPPYEHFYGDGTLIASWSGVRSLALPPADTDAYVSYKFKLPDDWTADKADIVVYYTRDDASTYSVTWNVGAVTAGESHGTSENNILSASTAYDFTYGTVGTVQELTVQLNDTDLDAGDIIQVEIQSDASNSGYLHIAGIWIEKGTAA
jgi:hypothetical protein